MVVRRGGGGWALTELAELGDCSISLGGGDGCCSLRGGDWALTELTELGDWSASLGGGDGCK